MNRPSMPRIRALSNLASALTLASILASVGCSSGVSSETASSGTDEPAWNLVLICFDTVRYDSFLAIDETGPGDALSPWTDRALRFTRAQAPAPWTIPSVASVMTGLSPPQHGAGRFASRVANLDVEVPTSLVSGTHTLAELLSARGYATAAFVAHPWFKSGFGLDRGFSTLKLRTRHEKIHASAIEWLDGRQADVPFFLYLHYMDAHDRHMGPMSKIRETVDSSPQPWREAALTSAPDGICSTPTSMRCLRYQVYLDAVQVLRAELASLLGDLEERGLLASTRVILYSDHGEEFKDHVDEERRLGLDPRGFAGVGHGHSLYQELLHVPLLLWGPELAGRDVDTPVSLTDIATTALAGRTSTAATGQSLLAAASEDPGGERPLYSSAMAYGPPQASVLLWPWKRVAGSDPRQRLLFDLATDPGEKHPVTDRRLELKLDGLLGRYLRSGAAAGGEAPSLSEEDLEELKALGYLGGHDS